MNKLYDLIGLEYNAGSLHIVMNAIENVGFHVEFWDKAGILVSSGRKRFLIHEKHIVGTTVYIIDSIEKA